MKIDYLKSKFCVCAHAKYEVSSVKPKGFPPKKALWINSLKYLPGYQSLLCVYDKFIAYGEKGAMLYPLAFTQNSLATT